MNGVIGLLLYRVGYGSAACTGRRESTKTREKTKVKATRPDPPNHATLPQSTTHSSVGARPKSVAYVGTAAQKHWPQITSFCPGIRGGHPSLGQKNEKTRPTPILSNGPPLIAHLPPTNTLEKLRLCSLIYPQTRQKNKTTQHFCIVRKIL